MTDEDRDRILAEARSNIAACRKLERDAADRQRDAADRQLEADIRQYLDKQPPMYRDPPRDLIRKTHFTETPAATHAPLPSERELNEILGQCFAIERAKIREELRAEQAAELAGLKNQISELRGRLDVVLTLLSGTKAADVLTLPRRA
jgi:hypothetical protein